MDSIMKTKLIRLTCFLNALLALATAARAQGTALTYQGRLTENGAAANGSNDFTFTLYNAASGGATVGASNVVNDLVVTNGLFIVTLDFGAAFDGSARWLEIAVRPGASAGAYANLTPRQPITATPYAVRAASVSGGIMASQLPPEALTVNGSRELAGSVRAIDPANVFAGDGSGLRDVAAGSVGPGDQLQYQSTYFRKLGTAPVPAALSSYGAGGAVVGDFNGDGRPDILVGLAGIGVSALYTNTTGGNVRLANPNGFGFYFFPRAIAVGDFTGDGSLDLAGVTCVTM